MISAANNRNSGTFSNDSPDNTLGAPISHVEQGAAEDAALNPDVPIAPRPAATHEKPAVKPTVSSPHPVVSVDFRLQAVAEALEAVRNDSTFNGIYHFGRNVVHRWQLIPLKQYRICAFIALVSLSVMWPSE